MRSRGVRPSKFANTCRKKSSCVLCPLDLLAECSTLLLLSRRLATSRLAGNRLLPVLLAAAQQLQVSSPAGQRLLGHRRETSRVLLVNLVCPDEGRLLGLDDLVASLDALRSTQSEKRTCQWGCPGALRSVVEELSYGLAGVLGPVLDFLSCA